jgi:hypothetical protein
VSIHDQSALLPLSLRPELDQEECSNPDCECKGEIFFDPACHPRASLLAFYAHGELTLICAECDNPMINIGVAGYSTSEAQPGGEGI